MKVLVIYDLIPEEQKRAIIEMSQDEYDYFSKGHNVIININDTEETSEVVNVIGNAFCDQKEHFEYCQTEKDKEYFGKWKSNIENDDISSAEKIICSGFNL